MGAGCVCRILVGMLRVPRGDQAVPRAGNLVSAPLQGAWLWCWGIPGSSPPCSPAVPACWPILGLHWVTCSFRQTSPEPTLSHGPALEEAIESLQPFQQLCWSVERVPSPAFARFYGSHFHLPPSPFPSLPLSLLLSDASRKRKFMEAVPRAVFPALVLVGACSWLAQPCLAELCPAPQLLHLSQKMDRVTLHLLPPGPQPPELLRASLDVPGTCSSLHLLWRIKFHFHIPTLGKMWILRFFWDEKVSDVIFLQRDEETQVLILSALISKLLNKCELINQPVTRAWFRGQAVWVTPRLSPIPRASSRHGPAGKAGSQLPPASSPASCAKNAPQIAWTAKLILPGLLNPQRSPRLKQQLQKAVLSFLCPPSCCPFFCIFPSLIFSLNLIPRLSILSIALPMLKLQRIQLKNLHSSSKIGFMLLLF